MLDAKLSPPVPCTLTPQNAVRSLGHPSNLDGGIVATLNRHLLDPLTDIGVEAAGDPHRCDEFDVQLMKRVRTGDAEALGDLMAAYWQPLVRYAHTFVTGLDLAEDIAQETFVRLWEHRREWTSVGTVRSFLYRIARNLAIDEQRKRKVRRLWIERIKRSPSPMLPPPDEVMEGDELYAIVEKAVRDLPSRRREVFILRRFHQLSYSQIADVMETTPRTVANQLSLALAQLRTALGPRLNSTP